MNWFQTNFYHNTNQRKQLDAWWRHQMETFSALLALFEGNPPATGGFLSQRPVMRSFDFFYLRRTKHLSKQSWGLWFIWDAIAPIMTSL